MRRSVSREERLRLSRSRAATALLLAALVCLPGPGALATERAPGGAPAAPARSQRSAPLERKLIAYDVVAVDRSALAAKAGGEIELPLETRYGRFDLVLEPHDVRAPEYRAEAVGDDGVARPLARMPASTYRGHARNAEGVEARFTLDAATVEGLVLTPGEALYVEPLAAFEPGADPSLLVVYGERDVIMETPAFCGVTLAERVGSAAPAPDAAEAAKAPGFRTADLATDADYEFVAANGSAEAANARIVGLVNQISAIYERDHGITIRVVYQNAWATANDPYTSERGTDTLDAFRNWWNANRAGVARDVAHLWTGRNLYNTSPGERGLIGLAWVGVVCLYDNRYSYGWSENLSGSAAVALTAHEIGHNFGACHVDGGGCSTDSTCFETIMMSYIGSGTALRFCDRSRETVGAYVRGNSRCLAPGGGPSCTSSVSAIAVEQTASGSLAATDCFGTVYGDRLHDELTFTAAAGRSYMVRMTSPAFDAYLVVIGPAGQVVAEDDDGNGGTDARVAFVAPSTGTYTIEATSDRAGATGAYAVSLTDRVTPAPPAALRAAKVGKKKATLAWRDASAEEASYEVVERAGDGWRTIRTLQANARRAKVSGLQRGTSYRLGVRACGAAGCSDVAEVSFTTK